jgi:ribosome-associated translation inhibitor RaiA
MLHIEISYSGTDRSDALDQRVREQVSHELRRFAERLTRVEAHLSDDNAEKAGERDKRCLLEARPRGMDPIAVTEEGDDLYEVAREAARKLSRALTTRFEKADAVR